MIGVTIAIIFLWIVYMVTLAHTDTITTVNIKSKKVIMPTNFFFISDIHRRKIKEQTLAKITKDIHFVVIGGDLVERNVPLDKVKNNIRLLKRWQAPIYFVWGNNDLEVEREELVQLLQEEDVIILQDQVIMQQRSPQNIQCIGFDYHIDHVEDQPQIDWESVQSNFTVVLTHKPASFYVLPQTVKAKIDLVLAGHTHGGQIRFFGIGPYERGGLFHDGATKVFISEGYGYSALPFRLGTASQCHTITILPVDGKND